MSEDASQQAYEALEMAGRIGGILRGRDPAVIGGALSEVVSKWLAGHHPSLREAMLKDFLEAVAPLVDINHKIILERYGGVWPERADPNIVTPSSDHPGPFPQEE